jgi:hypothetical protein
LCAFCIPPPPAKTEGSDGKVRPATEAARLAQRDAIAEALAANPDHSLAKVAELVGVSPMTVKSVKEDGARPPARREVPPVTPIRPAVETDPSKPGGPPPPNMEAILAADPKVQALNTAATVQRMWAAIAKVIADVDPAAAAAAVTADDREYRSGSAHRAIEWLSEFEKALNGGLRVVKGGRS